MPEMDAFIRALMAQMTLPQKVGQLNHPSSTGFDTTGVAESVDLEVRIRRGEIGGTAGGDLASRRALQELAISEGPNSIPLLFGVDVTHGHKTIFPIPLGLSCSWDLELIGRSARIAATEARADGINLNWSPMVDIGFDARWGRIAEGSGEFPYLGARIAEAIVKGYQGADGDLARPDRLMATVKHFAGYGLGQAGRDYNSVEASPGTLHRIMEPFRAGLAAGAGSLMVAFNTINDVPATAHMELLQDILRKDWGFDGLVVTDFTAVMELVNHGIARDLKEATYLAFKTGITTDLVSEGFVRYLPELVAEGRIAEAEVDTACRRILEAKWKLGLFRNPFIGMEDSRREKVTLTADSRGFARDAAARSCILLKNDNGALPLTTESHIIALIGPLADNRVDMQGTWAVSADPRNNVTILEGMRNAAGKDTVILYAKGSNIVDDLNLAARLNVHNRDNPSVPPESRSPAAMIAEAMEIAGKADCIVLCLGEAKEHAGESSTREDINIPHDQRPLFDKMAAYARESGKPLILLTLSGRPLALEHEARHADAILHSFHPGCEGANGIADVLFGKANPSGRLSMAFPRHVGQLPYQTEHLPTGRPIAGVGITIEGDDQRDESGEPIFRKFTTATILENASTPLYPAGYGLSYTSFVYGPIQVDKTILHGAGDRLQVSVCVRNSGKCAGTETVQLYIRDVLASVSRPVLELKGFEQLHLAPCEERRVTFTVTPEDLKFYRARTLSDYAFEWEPGEFEVMVGPNARDWQKARIEWQAAPLAA
jgi:beta-glucosidase